MSSSDIKKQSSEPYKSDKSNSSQKNNNLMLKLSNKPKQSPKSYSNSNNQYKRQKITRQDSPFKD